MLLLSALSNGLHGHQWTLLKWRGIHLSHYVLTLTASPGPLCYMASPFLLTDELRAAHSGELHEDERDIWGGSADAV